MSDHWIALIPENPRYVPDAAMRQRARDRFAQIAPDAEEIEIKVSDKVAFFDCGQNFERILCPSCGAEIPVDWWQDRMDEDSGVEGWQDQMDEDSGDGFKLATYATPCCGKECTLHELGYQWPQGFGRFALDAMNPDIGELEDKYKREFENILGTKLRVIYQHI
jgi:hypothetical protein